MSTSKKRKLLDKTSEIMQLRHYLIHTERAYCDWIKRYGGVKGDVLHFFIS
jgi:hypothetical protein